MRTGEVGQRGDWHNDSRLPVLVSYWMFDRHATIAASAQAETDLGHAVSEIAHCPGTSGIETLIRLDSGTYLPFMRPAIEEMTVTFGSDEFRSRGRRATVMKYTPTVISGVWCERTKDKSLERVAHHSG